MTIVSSTFIQTDFGEFKVSYHSSEKGDCVSFSQGNLSLENPLVRMHSACLFGEVFHSKHCDCHQQITETLRLIHEHKHGVIIYSYQEGRGIGLAKKIASMEIERTQHCDTVEALAKMGFAKSDFRTYEAEIDALKELKTAQKIQTFSGNPQKIKALEEAGFVISKRVHLEESTLSDLAKKEIETKKEKMGYHY